MLSLGVSKTLCNATVSSTTPKFDARCPPFLDTVCIGQGQSGRFMNKKPNDPKKGIFADGLWGKIFVEGTMIGMLTLLAFSIGNSMYSLEVRKNNGICIT